MTARDEIQKALERDPLRSLRIGDTLQVFHGATEAEVMRDVERRLKKGETLIRPDGTREFLRDEVIHERDGEDYVWDASGDRIKHNRYRVVIKKIDGEWQEVTRTFVTAVYKAWE